MSKNIAKITQRRDNNISHEVLQQAVPFKDVAVKDAVRFFLQDCSIRNLSEQTITWYGIKLKVFLDKVTEGFEGQLKPVKTPEDISLGHIKLFTLAYRKEGWADSTINGALRSVRAFLNYCHAEGLIREDVGAKVKIIKESQKIIETFSDEQLKKLLKQPDLATFVGLRDFTMILLLLDTGVRVSELIGMDVQGVNWLEGLILVDGKGNKQRHVPVQVTALKQLQKYVNIRGEVNSPALFVTLENTRISRRQVQERLKIYGRMAGIENIRCSPHTIRHTFAKKYIQNEGDPFTLQKILGHTDLTMTRRYVNMFDTDIREAHRKFSPVEGLFGR